MKRILLACAFVLVAVVSFWVGRQSTDGLKTPTEPANANAPKAQTSAQLDTSNSETSAEQATESVEPPQPESETSNEEELKREQLIAENPSFFEGQNEYFSDNRNYLYGVESFVPQNGISSWGVDREKELSNLLSDQDGLLHAESECRLTMCITTGAFMSQQEFRSFSIDYNNLQFYGQHYGTKSLADGLLVFYVITYKQTD